MRKLRITYVLPSLRVGGAEKHVVELATHLNKERFEPVIISLSDEGPLQLILNSARISTCTLSCTGAYNAKGIKKWISWSLRIKFLLRFSLFLRRQKPDIIHAYLPSPNIYSAFAKRFFIKKTKLIVSKRALGYYKEGRLLLRLAENWANRVADVVFVNSQAVKEDVLKREKVGPGKIRLIHNGIDVEKFSITINGEKKRREFGLTPDDKIVGVVANLIPYKGHVDLIKAARLVLNEAPETKFLLVGRDDGIMSQLENLAKELDIADAIIFLGPRQDIPELLQTFDVQVLASHEEGFSNVILEGMAAGKPLVVTDVGGNPEAVIHEETGLVVPPRDEKALAQAIIRLLKNPEEAHRFGQAAQQRVKEHFSIERMVQEMEALYEELVHRSS